MDSLNSWTGSGILERHPIVKYEDNGTQTASFTLRLEEQGKDQAVFKVFVPIECYGRVAERAGTLRVGDLVGVEGRLKWKTYVGTDQQKKGTLVIWAGQLTVLVEAHAIEEPVPVRPW